MKANEDVLETSVLALSIATQYLARGLLLFRRSRAREKLARKIRARIRAGKKQTIGHRVSFYVLWYK